MYESDESQEGDKKGSLYIQFNVVFPSYIAPEKKEEVSKILESAQY